MGNNENYLYLLDGTSIMQSCRATYWECCLEYWVKRIYINILVYHIIGVQILISFWIKNKSYWEKNISSYIYLWSLTKIKYRFRRKLFRTKIIIRKKKWAMNYFPYDMQSDHKQVKHENYNILLYCISIATRGLLFALFYSPHTPSFWKFIIYNT